MERDGLDGDRAPASSCTAPSSEGRAAEALHRPEGEAAVAAEQHFALLRGGGSEGDAEGGR